MRKTADGTTHRIPLNSFPNFAIPASIIAMSYHILCDHSIPPLIRNSLPLSTGNASISARFNRTAVSPPLHEKRYIKETTENSFAIGSGIALDSRYQYRMIL